MKCGGWQRKHNGNLLSVVRVSITRVLTCECLVPESDVGVTEEFNGGKYHLHTVRTVIDKEQGYYVHVQSLPSQVVVLFLSATPIVGPSSGYCEICVTVCVSTHSSSCSSQHHGDISSTSNLHKPMMQPPLQMFFMFFLCISFCK